MKESINEPAYISINKIANDNTVEGDGTGGVERNNLRCGPHYET